MNGAGSDPVPDHGYAGYIPASLLRVAPHRSLGEPRPLTFRTALLTRRLSTHKRGGVGVIAGNLPDHGFALLPGVEA